MSIISFYAGVIPEAEQMVSTLPRAVSIGLIIALAASTTLPAAPISSQPDLSRTTFLPS